MRLGWRGPAGLMKVGVRGSGGQGVGTRRCPRHEGTFRCNVFDSEAAQDCRMEDAEAYEFFDLEKAASAPGSESEAATTSRSVHGSFTVQEQVARNFTRTQRYLPHGGLGLCLIVCWAYFANSKKLATLQERKAKERRVLEEKKDWLKSRTLLSMSPQDEQQQKVDSTEYPESLMAAEDDGSLARPTDKVYDSFLRDSKADRVLAPSEIFLDGGEGS